MMPGIGTMGGRALSTAYSASAMAASRESVVSFLVVTGGFHKNLRVFVIRKICGVLGPWALIPWRFGIRGLAPDDFELWIRASCG